MEDTTRFLLVELYKVYLEGEVNNIPYHYMRTLKTVQSDLNQGGYFSLNERGHNFELRLIGFVVVFTRGYVNMVVMCRRIFFGLFYIKKY